MLTQKHSVHLLLIVLVMNEHILFHVGFDLNNYLFNEQNEQDLKESTNANIHCEHHQCRLKKRDGEQDDDEIFEDALDGTGKKPWYKKTWEKTSSLYSKNKWTILGSTAAAVTGVTSFLTYWFWNPISSGFKSLLGIKATTIAESLFPEIETDSNVNKPVVTNNKVIKKEDGFLFSTNFWLLVAICIVLNIALGIYMCRSGENNEDERRKTRKTKKKTKTKTKKKTKTSKKKRKTKKTK